MQPGECIAAEGDLELSPGRDRITVRVENTGDRPIQVGSHFHFADTNAALAFDRAAADGFRLDVPVGTGMRFEPGLARDVDLVRLGDTNLFISPTEDRTMGPGGPGDEAVFGGGKVIRESMGQATHSGADLVITNVLVLDHWGVVKCDVGVRGGRIVALGKAGNPDTSDGVHPDLVIGPSTEILAGGGRILTAGAFDSHVHLICPQVIPEALAAGITTLIGGGTGPAEGTKATTVTPGPWYLDRMLEALDAWPVNVALLAKGNTVSADELDLAARSGAVGYKLHEDWGTTPAAIDACLRACDRWGLQAALHTDTLNEAGYVRSTLAAIGSRNIHSYHTEGAGGGHAPDIMTVSSFPNILPSSTNPTRPHTVNTIAEHLDMLMVCHHLNPNVPEDLAFAESRVRPSTIAAEDWLHDLGAISIIGSDSQAMGRIGEVVTRTFQTAHVMKDRRGALDGEPVAGADNLRARRYIAKVTIGPAMTHGLDGEVGSVEPGKLADLCLWEPAFFGVRPSVVLKGGVIAWAQMGDANASHPTPPTGDGPADVRCHNTVRYVRGLGGAGRPRGRAGRPPGRATVAAAGAQQARPGQGRSARERHLPADRHRPP